MYNTILGAKPLESDGDIYYSDYQLQDARFIRRTAGLAARNDATVAADYRINTYFRDGEGVRESLHPLNGTLDAGRSADCADSKDQYPTIRTWSSK